MRKTCVLAPRCQSIIQAHVQPRKGQEANVADASVMLQPVSSIVNELGIFPARTLHYADQKTIPVLAYNPNDESVVIEPETVVGLLVGVDEVNEFTEEVDYETSDHEVSDHENVRSVNTESIENINLPPHVQSLYENSIKLLDEGEALKVKQFLLDYADVYSKDDFDIGRAQGVEHTIDVGDSKPIKSRPHRMSPEKREAAKTIVNNLLEQNMIVPSKSEWASPILLVKKKDFSQIGHRLQIDE